MQKSSLLLRWLPDLLTAIGLALAPYVLPHLGFSEDTMNRILVFGLFGIRSEERRVGKECA